MGKVYRFLITQYYINGWPYSKGDKNMNNLILI